MNTSPITPWGRLIHGPTLPGQGIRCARQSPLTPAEVEEVAEIIARGRTERRSAVLLERLKTRHWDSIMAVMERLNAKLAAPPAGRTPQAASAAVQKAGAFRQRAGRLKCPAPQCRRRGAFCQRAGRLKCPAPQCGRRGPSAMGNPLTSLTWLANWLRVRGQGLLAGEFVSTGTCTGHFFAAPADRLDVNFGEIGKLVVTYE